MTSPSHDPKFACFITVRTASSRLPKKALLKLKGKTVLEHLIERVKCVQHPVQIVVCTTTLDEDDVIRDIAENHAVACYRGPSADKVVRRPAAPRDVGIGSLVIEDHESPEKEQQPCLVLSIPCSN